MYMVKAIVGGKVGGIGRVVGDVSIVCGVSDICVRQEYQGKVIGLRIVNKLKTMIEDRVKEGANLIKYHHCGAPIDDTNGLCSYCDSEIKYLQEWILENKK